MTQLLPPPFSGFHPTGTRDSDLARLDTYWRAANYLSVGQIYLLDNALVREPLLAEHTKPRLIGHWGTSPGLNFVYAHLSRVITERDPEAPKIAAPAGLDRIPTQELLSLFSGYGWRSLWTLPSTRSQTFSRPHALGLGGIGPFGPW
jgi:phosphoketolase